MNWLISGRNDGTLLDYECGFPMVVILVPWIYVETCPLSYRSCSLVCHFSVMVLSSEYVTVHFVYGWGKRAADEIVVSRHIQYCISSAPFITGGSKLSQHKIQNPGSCWCSRFEVCHAECFIAICARTGVVWQVRSKCVGAASCLQGQTIVWLG